MMSTKGLTVAAEHVRHFEPEPGHHFESQKGFGGVGLGSIGTGRGRTDARARRRCQSLAKKRVTPHSLRHSLAMNLLHHGVDRSVIALWLGHESVETTSIYLQADMELKERALAKTGTTPVRASRYRPSDRVLAFLSSL